MIETNKAMALLDAKWSIVKILMLAAIFISIHACTGNKAEELSDLKVEDGLKVTLVAEEPLNPIVPLLYSRYKHV